MKRRDFLKFLLASAAAEYVDYEKLLWVPGEKKIFLPSELPLHLYGIPYHHSDYPIGEWLGLFRVPLEIKPGGSFMWTRLADAGQEKLDR